MTIDPPRHPMTPLDYDQRACDRDDILTLASRLDLRLQSFIPAYREPANEDVYEVVQYIEHIAAAARRMVQ